MCCVKAERMGEILDRVAENGSVDVPSLADEFKDLPRERGVAQPGFLRVLQPGLLRRTHGGAATTAGLELALQCGNGTRSSS